MTNYGKFMHKYLLKLSLKLNKRKMLYYLLQFTWGLITNMFGWLYIIIIYIVYKVKPRKYQNAIYFAFGRQWGGLSLGINIFIDNHLSKYTLLHEYGHSYQNAILGPFWLILIGIPSFIRYWIFRIKEKMGKEIDDYNKIWFEYNATLIGTEIWRQQYEKGDRNNKER